VHDYWESGPTYFSVWRKVNWVVNKVEVALGRFPNNYGQYRPIPNLRIAATPGEGREYWSDAPWAPAPAGRRKQATYVFECNHGHRSSELTVSGSTNGVTTNSKGLSGKAPTPGGLINADIRRTTVTNDVDVADDPPLAVELVLPSNEGRLIDLALEDAFIKGEDLDLYRSMARDLVPSQVPDGWSFQVDSDHFQLSAGEHATFRIHVDQPTPGRLVFAVAVRDLSTGELIIGDFLEVERGD
jgi:hypothetical protein